MKLKIIFYTTAVFTFLVVGHALAAPKIFNLLIDGSGAISDEDFTPVQDAVVSFISCLHDRAQRRTDELPDWLSVIFFGNDDDYRGARFANCSLESEMRNLATYIANQRHPHFTGSAFYTAIAKGTIESLEHAKSKTEELDLSTSPFGVDIILVTDGRDRSANFSLKNLVKQTFPTEGINLFIVSVGPYSDVSEFSNIADQVIEIDNFEMLPGALMRILDNI